jgi:bacteriocin biosynthesis cyclodehydratase domain-containing protein
MSESLPRTPTLRGSCNLLPMDALKALVVSASTTFVLRGSAVGELLPFLISKLDGRNTVEAIVRELSTFREEDVNAALHLLSSNGLLEDSSFDLIPQPDREQHSSEIQFFSGYGWERTPESYRKLRGARVGLLGASETTTEAARGLAMCGVASIRIGFLGSAEDSIPMRHLDVLIKDMDSINPGGNHTLTALSNAGPAGLENFIDDLSIAIVLANEWPTTFLEHLNRVCLQRGAPWMLCLLEGLGASVGPLFYPGETACFTCYSRRRRGAEEFVGAYDAVRGAAGRSFYARIGTMPGMAQFAAGLAVMETVKFITSFEVPASLGTELRFDLFSSRMEPHRVLKLPRCPDCGPARLHLPQTSIWQGFLDEEALI